MQTLQLAILGAALVTTATAQLTPGTFLATATGNSSAHRGVWTVDRFLNTSSRLNIARINWANTSPERVFIEDQSNFLLLVSAGQPVIWRVSHGPGGWSATQLSSSPPQLWAWELTEIGTWIYFARSAAGQGPGTSTAEIWRLPAKGGTPSLYFHLSRAGMQGIPRAMVAVGTELHVFSWYGSATVQGGEHVSIDTAVPSPVLARRGLLPMSNGYCPGNNSLVREASYDPFTRQIVIGCRTGDVIWRLPAGATVRHETVLGRCSNLTNRDEWGEALGLNTDTGAVLVGDGLGNLEERICGWKTNVHRLNGAPVGTTVTGIEYFAGGNLFRAVGPGCAQSNGRIPCSYVATLPRPGSRNFAFTVEAAGRAGILIIGATHAPTPLPPAPGCTLGTQPLVLVAGTPTATGFAVPIPLPPALPPGATIYTQWAVEGANNTLNLAFSETHVVR